MFNNGNYFGRTPGFFQGFEESHESPQTGYKDDVNVEVEGVVGVAAVEVDVREGVFAPGRGTVNNTSDGDVHGDRCDLQGLDATQV